MRLLGRKLAIFIGGKVIGLSTAASINIVTDMTEKASTSKSAKEFLPGRYSFTLQCDRLYDATSDDSDNNMQRYLMLSQLRCDLLSFSLDEATMEGGELVPSINTQMTVSGSVYVSGFTVNAPAEGYASVSISFQGTGELDIIY